MDSAYPDFNLSRLERVLSGPGKASALAGELERLGATRAVVVTGKTLGASALLDRLILSGGPRCVGVFRGARQHVPRSSVNELVATIERLGADALVSFGGGSPIDTCKVAVHTLLDRRAIAHVAIPTTLSAGEYTHSAGVTDEATLVKSGVSDPRLQARTVIQDPAVTVETPDWLWAATAMRALDHAVESCYASRHHPISDALGAQAIALLLEHLWPSLHAAGTERLAHRGRCLMAAWFSIFGSMNTRFGISHLLGHQIGPRWNVPHGVTSCVTLPHVMRFMAGVAPERFAAIAQGFGVPFDPGDPKSAALACAERTAAFVARFGLPRTLGEAGVPPSEIGAIVDTVLHEIERTQVAPRPMSRDDVLALLLAAS